MALGQLERDKMVQPNATLRLGPVPLHIIAVTAFIAIVCIHSLRKIDKLEFPIVDASHHIGKA